MKLSLAISLLLMQEVQANELQKIESKRAQLRAHGKDPDKADSGVLNTKVDSLGDTLLQDSSIRELIHEVEDSRCCFSADCTSNCAGTTSAERSCGGNAVLKPDNSCKPLGTCYSDDMCQTPVTFPIATEGGCFDHSYANSWKDKATGACSQRGGNGGGDPHFKTFGKEAFSFMGICDVVAVIDRKFANTLGIEMHLRLSQTAQFSSITEAVLKIGGDIFWTNSLGDFTVNGVAGTMTNTTTANIAGFPFSHWHVPLEYYNLFIFDFKDGSSIEIKSFESIIYATANGGAAFKDSQGLFGYGSSKSFLGRDGITNFNDPWEFGLEWQVRDTDSQLFPTSVPPQWPEKCWTPQGNVPLLAHAAANTEATVVKVSREDAEKACTHIKDDIDKTNCIFDVLATGNLDLGKLEDVDEHIKVDMKEVELIRVN